jgi:hypothetical protein
VRAVPAHLAAAKLLATIRTCPEDLGRTTESVSLGRKESSGSHSDGFDINLTFGNNHRMGNLASAKYDDLEGDRRSVRLKLVESNLSAPLSLLRRPKILGILCLLTIFITDEPLDCDQIEGVLLNAVAGVQNCQRPEGISGSQRPAHLFDKLANLGKP